MKISITRAVIGMVFLLGMFTAIAKSAAPPEDLLHIEPFVSTAKVGFVTSNESIATSNARAKAVPFSSVEYAPVTGWKLIPQANVKLLKPDADVSELEDVKLTYKWKEEVSAAFRTEFTMPETVNGFAIADSPVSLLIDGHGTIDVYVNGKRVTGFVSSGELDLTGKLAPGKKIVLGIKVSDLTQKGSLNSVRLQAKGLNVLSAPANEIITKLDNAGLLLEQLPKKPKALFETVTKVSSELDKLKEVTDVTEAKASLEKMVEMLAPIDKLTEKFPIFNAGPYLQAVKPNEITVAWETRVEAPSEVWYGKDGLTEVVSDPTPVKFHKVVISGLEQETQYKYMAVSSKLAAPESTFNTAIKRDTPFKFTVFADTQSNPQIFEPIVDLMIKEDPDLTISVGDEVGCGSDYTAWKREFLYPLRRLAIEKPFFVAIGNHEYCAASCGEPVEWFENYMAVPNLDGYYQAVTYGNSRFILLNQQADPGCPGVIPGTKQYEWLLEELESPEYKAADFHFMFLHKPPYSNCWAGGYYDGESSVRHHIVPLIEKYGIDMVFSGHTHDYERGQWPVPDGTYYIITGGGGGHLDDTQYKDWDQMQMHKFVHHFSLISIDGKNLAFKAIDMDGNLIDSFEIKK